MPKSEIGALKRLRKERNKKIEDDNKIFRRKSDWVRNPSPASEKDDYPKKIWYATRHCPKGCKSVHCCCYTSDYETRERLCPAYYDRLDIVRKHKKEIVRFLAARRRHW